MDVYAVSSVIVFVSGYLSWWILLSPVYHFIASFTVVRKATMDSLKKQVAQLEHDVDLMKQGIFITQDNNGQLSFDLPQEELVTKKIPVIIDNEKWEQVWDIHDWTNYSLNKKFVRRGRKYFWVDELLPSDKEVNLPFEWVFKGETKRRRGRKSVFTHI